MISLLLSILASTIIFVVFKLFERYNINNFQAIVLNYIVAGFCGLIVQGEVGKLTEIPEFSWFPFAVLLGGLFIFIFFLMALTTQKNGLSVVSVATKMSVVVPIVFGLVYYHESLEFLKALGIILALIAVYLASIKSSQGLKISKRNLLLPLLVFLGSGVIDTSLKFLEEEFISPTDVAIFSSTIFFAAGTIGIIVSIIQRIRNQFRFELKSIIGGIALGVPNFFSIYFLVGALRSDIMESSGIFTVNNIGIVMVSTLAGIILFKEKLLLKNWLGIFLAIISIALIAIARM